MQIKKGIPVSPGVAIYPAVVLDAEDQPIPRRTVPAAQVSREHGRLEASLKAATGAIQHDREQAAKTVGQKLADMFGAHIVMLSDPTITGQMRSMIDSERVTAEYAAYTTLQRLVKTWQTTPFLREKVSDLRDLERRILKHLIGRTRTELSNLQHQAVVVAHDLTPSQTAALDKSKIKGIATDLGGRTSHTAILAHALGIPAIVGLEDVSSSVNTGDMVIIDGARGTVVIEPDAAKIMEYRQELRRMAAVEDTLGEVRGLPAVTTDGTPITLLANIEFPSEIAEAIHNGAQGVGLYRTEFLYLAFDAEPTEDQQYETYSTAIKALGGRPLTIRTLDLGADKVLGGATFGGGDHVERNPFLGCRSIRLCLQNLPLFKTQLRAILRASVEGPVKIMFPLISSIMELRQARMILQDVMEDLDDAGIPYRENIPVGIMVEVPSAALQARTFTRETDFFSIGTNDLIQYTVAVDRGNERIASLYSAGHPAVITLVKEVIRTAGRSKLDVSLCGEMASEPEFTMLLLGLGLRTLSITPPAIPEIKKIIRSVSIDHCQRVARKVSSFDSDREVINYLRGELSKVAPDLSEGLSFGY